MQSKIIIFMASLLVLALIFLPTIGAVLTQKVMVRVNSGTDPSTSEAPFEVPVPATVGLFVSGIVGLIGINRRLRK